MKNGKGIGFQSAMLVNKWIVAGFFAMSLIAVRLGAVPIALLFLAFGVIGGMSALWGMSALNNISVEVRAQSRAISCGETVTFDYFMENDKALPLIWLEICQDVPKNDCLTPDDRPTGTDTCIDLLSRKRHHSRIFLPHTCILIPLLRAKKHIFPIFVSQNKP